MSSLRFGIVGAGAIAESAVNSITAITDAAFAGVYDVNAERAQALAKRASGAKAYATTTALFADPAIDAVYIAVPNCFHAKLAEAALRAGKHVLLDKPFALNLKEAKKVAAAAKAAKRTFMVGMNQRFTPEAQRIRAVVARGDLGEVYHVKTCWYRRAGIPKLGTWFGNKKLSGGGCTLDIGVHMLDLAMFLTGRFDPVAVMGATYGKFGHRGLGEGGWGRSERDPKLVFDVEDFASAMVRFRNGMTLNLDVTWACHSETDGSRNVVLYGTEAGASTFPAKLFRPAKDGDYQVLDKPNATLAWPHGCRFHNFVDAVRGRCAPAVGINEALAVQAVLDGMYASAKSGMAVAIA